MILKFRGFGRFRRMDAMGAEERMNSYMVQWMKWNNAPSEHYEWLGLEGNK